jgi:hypothetical protein
MAGRIAARLWPATTMIYKFLPSLQYPEDFPAVSTSVATRQLAWNSDLLITACLQRREEGTRQSRSSSPFDRSLGDTLWYLLR